MKIHKLYSPDPVEPSAPPAEPTAPIVEPTAPVVPEPVEPVAPEPPAAEPVSIEKADMSALAKELGIDAEEMKTSSIAKTQPAAPAEPVASEVKTDELSFKIPEKKVEEPKDYESWTDLAKSFNIDLKEDNEVAFKGAYEKHINEIKDAVRKETETVTLNKELAQLDPETQIFFDFIKNGGKKEDFIKPLQVYEKFEKMDDEDLIRETLKTQKVAEDVIDQTVVDLIDGNKLSDEAKRIRTFVASEKVTYSQKIADQQKLVYQNAYKAETERIKTAIGKVDKFMDVDIPKEVKETVISKIDEYREKLRNDDELVAKMILFAELGDEAKEIAKKSGFNEARNKFQSKLHNLESIPQRNAGTASRADKSQGKTLAQQWSEGLGVKEED